MGFFNDRQKEKIKQAQTQLRGKTIEAAQVAESQADSFLSKLGKSKWTWVIVAAIIAAAWLLGFIQG